AGLTPSAINWTAIGSTETVNARVNTATRATDPSVPIYRVDGAQVASSNSDLWDGTILQSRISVDEGGNTKSDVAVWTGTLADGTTRFNRGWLGSNQPVGIGDSVCCQGPYWVEAGAFGQFGQREALYGISSIITVPTATTATPEPSSLLSFITLGGLILGGAVRGVRK
ncbi:MAG: hypothetical protein RLZZ148_1489, partial [Cyanobacteriota bacterium]